MLYFPSSYPLSPKTPEKQPFSLTITFSPAPFFNPCWAKNEKGKLCPILWMPNRFHLAPLRNTSSRFPADFSNASFFSAFFFCTLDSIFPAPSLYLFLKGGCPIAPSHASSVKQKSARQNVNNSNNISLIRHSNEAGFCLRYTLNIVGLRFGSLACHSFWGTWDKNGPRWNQDQWTN